MTDRIHKRFLYIFTGKLGRYVVLIAMTPILVRILGSRLYGDYAFMLSALSVVISLTQPAVFDGIRKFLAEERTQLGWREETFRFYLLMTLVVGFVAVAGILVADSAGLISSLLAPRFRTYFYLLGGLILLKLLFALSRGALLGMGLERWSEPLVLVQNLVMAVVGVTLAYLGFGVEGVLSGEIVALFGVFVVSTVLVSRQLSVSRIASFDLKVPSRETFFRFSILSVAFSFLNVSLLNVDILLLQPLSGSSTTGYYKAALLVAEFIWFVPNAVQTTFLHSTSELWDRGAHKRISTLSSRTTRYTLLLSTLLALGLVALADSFIALYFGPDFVVAVEPLLLLLPGALGFAVARPIFAISQGKGELGIPIVATGTAAAVNLVLNLLLIPSFGMLGAATATSVGYGSMLGFHVWAAHRVGFDPLLDLRLVPTLVTGLVAAAPILLLDAAIESHVLGLAVVPPVGLLVFLAGAVLTGALDREELTAVFDRFLDDRSFSRSPERE